MARTGSVNANRWWFIEYEKVLFACIHAPGIIRKNADGHTVGSYAYGNPAGARYAAASRPQVCDKCGGKVVSGANAKGLHAAQRQGRNEYDELR